jgi:hypothetical protein
MHLFSYESPSLELNFCSSSLNLGVEAISQENLNPPQLLEVSHTLSHSTVLPPHSLNLRYMVSPQNAVTSRLWETVSLPFCLLRQAWIWTQVLSSLMHGAPLPSLVPAPHQVVVHLRPSPWLTGRMSLDLPLVPGEIFWQSRGCTPATREVTNHHLCNPSNKPPRNVRISSWDTGHWGSLAGSNILLCQNRLSRLGFKGWAPRPKGSHLIYPCKQVTEAKSKAQHTYGCMWLHWLFHSPSAMWPSSCFNTFKFYLFALPCLPPGSLSEHSLSVSLVVLLPATGGMSRGPMEEMIKEQQEELGRTGAAGLNCRSKSFWKGQHGLELGPRPVRKIESCSSPPGSANGLWAYSEFPLVLCPSEWGGYPHFTPLFHILRDRVSDPDWMGKGLQRCKLSYTFSEVCLARLMGKVIHRSFP